MSVRGNQRNRNKVKTQKLPPAPSKAQGLRSRQSPDASAWRSCCCAPRISGFLKRTTRSSENRHERIARVSCQLLRRFHSMQIRPLSKIKQSLLTVCSSTSCCHPMEPWLVRHNHRSSTEELVAKYAATSKPHYLQENFKHARLPLITYFKTISEELIRAFRWPLPVTGILMGCQRRRSSGPRDT